MHNHNTDTIADLVSIMYNNGYSRSQAAEEILNIRNRIEALPENIGIAGAIAAELHHVLGTILHAM